MTDAESRHGMGICRDVPDGLEKIEPDVPDDVQFAFHVLSVLSKFPVPEHPISKIRRIRMNFNFFEYFQKFSPT